MDPRMCPLLNLTMYIETTANMASSSFLFGNRNDGDRVVRRFLADTIQHSEFKTLKAGKLGTPSFRNGATAYATRSGVSKDFVNRRGRWRTPRGWLTCILITRSHTPTHTQLRSWPALLDLYLFLTEGMRCVTSSFLVNEIAPTIKQVMGEPIVRTLAHPLLWAALEPDSGFNYCLLFQNLKYIYDFTAL
ncbi:hypothetical protein JG687_00009544 [Phytophthora cactorum]|uniref:Uncharacterized protein n=1 Tax=Phytophthora cactorum TaxID=29920 RepID=A0A8T1UBV6_9STRA|nr:hypothetical protein JG687_00009544 [Phytophthora cactorum]